MKEQYEFPSFTAYPIEENILHIEMKSVDKLSAKDIEEMNDCFLRAGNGSKVFLLVTFRGFIQSSDKVIKAAIKKRDLNIHGAKAYVVDNLALRLGINFFKNFHKHSSPISVFSDKDKAISWLRKEKSKFAALN
jgi:hypothetical protein